MDWREMLGNIIANATERDRIAAEMGIHPVTLSRWVAGDSSPRSQNMRQLLRALSKSQRLQMLPLIEDEHLVADLAAFDIDTFSHELPFSFVMEVLEARATVPDMLRFWTLSRLILQHALYNLDPEKLGMSISIVRAMAPHQGKIRSLREVLGIGTFPWPSDLEEKALLLGAESLAGHVTVACRLEQIGDLRYNKSYLPAYQTEHEISAVAAPVMYASRVAGCLLISSTQPDFFTVEGRLALVHSYANLLALAFNAADFYEPESFVLHIMPPFQVQQDYLVNFRFRVLQLMQEAARSSTRLASLDAEQLVWQEIEEALIHRTLS